MAVKLKIIRLLVIKPTRIKITHTQFCRLPHMHIVVTSNLTDTHKHTHIHTQQRAIIRRTMVREHGQDPSIIDEKWELERLRKGAGAGWDVSRL